MFSRKEHAPSPDMDMAQLVGQSIALERAAFLMRVKVPLALAGVLVLMARIAGRFPATQVDGWPTTIIWVFAGAICMYGAYHLLHPRSETFLRSAVSMKTRNSLLLRMPPKQTAIFQRAQPVIVADLERLRVAFSEGRTVKVRSGS